MVIFLFMPRTNEIDVSYGKNIKKLLKNLNDKNLIEQKCLISNSK